MHTRLGLVMLLLSSSAMGQPPVIEVQQEPSGEMRELMRKVGKATKAEDVVALTLKMIERTGHGDMMPQDFELLKAWKPFAKEAVGLIAKDLTTLDALSILQQCAEDDVLRKHIPIDVLGKSLAKAEDSGNKLTIGHIIARVAESEEKMQAAKPFLRDLLGDQDDMVRKQMAMALRYRDADLFKLSVPVLKKAAESAKDEEDHEWGPALSALLWQSIPDGYALLHNALDTHRAPVAIQAFRLHWQQAAFVIGDTPILKPYLHRPTHNLYIERWQTALAKPQTPFSLRANYAQLLLIVRDRKSIQTATEVLFELAKLNVVAQGPGFPMGIIGGPGGPPVIFGPGGPDAPTGPFQAFHDLGKTGKDIILGVGLTHRDRRIRDMSMRLICDNVWYDQFDALAKLQEHKNGQVARLALEAQIQIIATVDMRSQNFVDAKEAEKWNRIWKDAKLDKRVEKIGGMLAAKAKAAKDDIEEEDAIELLSRIDKPAAVGLTGELIKKHADKPGDKQEVKEQKEARRQSLEAKREHLSMMPPP